MKIFQFLPFIIIPLLGESPQTPVAKSLERSTVSSWEEFSEPIENAELALIEFGKLYYKDPFPEDLQNSKKAIDFDYYVQKPADGYNIYHYPVYEIKNQKLLLFNQKTKQWMWIPKRPVYGIRSVEEFIKEYVEKIPFDLGVDFASQGRLYRGSFSLTPQCGGLRRNPDDSAELVEPFPKGTRHLLLASRCCIGDWLDVFPLVIPGSTKGPKNTNDGIIPEDPTYIPWNYGKPIRRYPLWVRWRKPGPVPGSFIRLIGLNHR